MSMGLRVEGLGAAGLGGVDGGGWVVEFRC